MRAPRRILLYVVVAVQLLSFLSIGWDGLRHVALPDGATPTQALMSAWLTHVRNWRKLREDARRSPC
jgi:hypothetical protein